MLKIQEIENKLLIIDGNVFQNLCDAYIFITEPLCDNIHRPGSQIGKQKAVIGTPDSYYILPSGRYVLLEYTTQAPEPKNALLNKIKADIDKCTDSSKTGLSLPEIEKITYCLNSRLSLKEHKDLTQYAREKGINLDVKTLDTFSIGLFSKASHVAKEFLGVEIDSGQVLAIKTFIKSYERTGYATPLTNQFVGREKELNDLEEMVLNSPVTILTGPPGVGKTKIVVELFEKLSDTHKEFEIFCIDNKHIPIYDDLKTKLSSLKNYILLIDDANRQVKNLKQILSLLKEERQGKLHIIITVRDYAFVEIESHATSYKPSVLRLEKFSDEQLTKLLQSPDFDIQNHRFSKRILEIADGNPRLAIMAAKIAINKQDLMALEDVSDLYDQYFESALNPTIFKDNTLLKTLGIISFFHSLNKTDSDFYEKILQNFSMNRYEFEEALVQLENLELVESSSDLSVIRISEQVLGTYFFYRTFFKNPLLNFETILLEYFFTHLFRVKDTIIPANNTFGYKNVYEKIDPYLINFWKTIENDEEKALKYMDMFWLYKQDEALHFIFNKIQSLPELQDSTYYYDEKAANSGYQKDIYLGLLSKFYFHSLPNIKDVFELSAAYVSRKPECYSELVKLFKDILVFSHEDERSGYYRQQKFVEFLSTKCSTFPDSLRIQLFYDAIPALMKTSFNVVAGSRKRNSMSIYTYNLSLAEPVKKIRTNIWKLFKKNFKKDKTKSILFLHEYLQRTPDKVKEIFSFDLAFVIGIMHDLFDSASFKQCYVVQEFVAWFKRIGIKDECFGELQTKFNSVAYKNYLLLTYDYLKGRSEDDSRLNYEDYQKHKENEIRKNFSLNDLKSFKVFYKIYLEIAEALSLFNYTYRLEYSLDIVLHEAYKRNTKALSFFKHIASTGNQSDYVPFRFYAQLAEDINAYEKFYDYLAIRDFSQKSRWILNWLQFIPEKEITELHTIRYLDLFKTGTNINYVNFDNLAKFKHVSPEFYIDLLEIINHRNTIGDTRVLLWDIFEKHLNEFASRLDLVKKTYLHQQTLSDSFDHDYKDFLEIIKLDGTFVSEYILYWSNGHYLSLREHEGLSIIWKHPEAKLLLGNAFDILCENHPGYVREDFCNVFFKRMTPDSKSDAIQFLKEYLTKNSESIEKVNTVFDCIRHSFPSQLESMLLHFLEIQSSFEIFSEIEWTASSFFGNGETIVGDIKAADYQKVMDILGRIDKQAYLFSKHKSYIKERIQDSKKYADQERKRMFMNEDW